MDQQDLLGGLILIAGAVAVLWALSRLVRVVAVVIGRIAESMKRLLSVAIEEIQRPSHVLYVGLFALGAFGSALRVIRYVSDLSKPEPIKALLFWSLWAFFSTNILQQYLIYRTCIAAELPSSTVTLTYGPWWVGTRLEKILRLIVVVLLLSVAGEVIELQNVAVIARLNICLFLIFALWNLAALACWNSAGHRASVDAALIRKHVVEGTWLDLFAVALWSFVWASMSYEAAYTLMILTAVLYAFLVVWIHVRAAPWNRSVFIAFIGTVFLIFMARAFYRAVLDDIRLRISTLAPDGIG